MVKSREMYPNQPQYPVDYLDQIAPSQRKSGPGGRPLLYAVLALIGVVLFAVAAFIFSQVVSGNSNEQTLAARLATTQQIADGAQRTIRANDLRSLNSNLTIYLTNVNRDISAPMQAVDVNTAELNERVVAAESGTEITARLETARLNAQYDRVYAREMAYQLETTIALMRQTYNSTRSSALRDFLDDAYQNLQPIQTQFADYSATTS